MRQSTSLLVSLLVLRVLLPNAGAAEVRKRPPGTYKERVAIPRVGNLRYTIDVPDGYDGKSPVPLVLALHYGYGGDEPKPFTGGVLTRALRPGLAKLRAIVIAPDALGGDWTDARNEKAAVWLTRSAMKAYAIDAKKVVITGYSMGGTGTWFIGSRHQDLFTGAVPMAAATLTDQKPWKIPVYVIHSDADDLMPYRDAKKHAEGLKSKGSAVEFRTVTGLTHDDTGSYADFLGDGLTWLESRWK